LRLEKEGKIMPGIARALALTSAIFLLTAPPASAQKSGGVLILSPRQPGQRIDPRGSDDLGGGTVHGGIQ
jgi:hypothetical protein